MDTEILQVLRAWPAEFVMGTANRALKLGLEYFFHNDRLFRVYKEGKEIKLQQLNPPS